MGTNTGIGIGIGIPFRNNALGGDNIYFPPELKARMIGVWDNYGKKNTDADRNIIKNKIPNAGGDLEILNSAYKLNSGFGEYREDFTSWIVSKEPMTVEKTDSQVHVSYIGTSYKELPMFEYSGSINNNYSLIVDIQGIPDNVIGKFIHNNGFVQEVTNGINTIKFSNSGSWYGFTFYREDNIIIGNCDITIKQIPAFEGALVTDGINDIVASIKTLEEWNIGDKGITIVSMIHQINTNTNNFITTNNIRTDNKVIGRNIVSNIEKTGIYGWYKENIQSDTINVINNILGDENDYTSHSSPSTNINPINNSKFYVQGYAVENGFAELSSVAHYWTFAVLGKATADEINLIIAKYNLDRTLRPDILCNITKQGITNDNHADFNDKLVDYSGNGRDIQMYNLAWKGGSGVAAKQYESLKDWRHTPFAGTTVIRLDEFSYNIVSNNGGYWQFRVDKTNEPTSQIRVITDRKVTWINNIKYAVEGESSHKDKYKTTIIEANTPTIINIAGFDFFDPIEGGTFMSVLNYGQVADDKGYTLTILPSCKGGILLDGINDFGKVTGMPIYKDYTFIIEREFLNETFPNQACLVSKSKVASEIENGGAFIVDNISVNSIINPYSFYKTTSLPGLNTFDRQIVFQSKYKYLDKDIAAGTSTDSDTLWLGTFRDNDQRFLNGAIYSLMSFPYSMSKFLIERQLKKHKLGTLYPNMVEFRPVIKANANYNIFYTALLPLTGDIWERINIGDYVPVGRRIAIQMSFDNEASELVSAISSQLGNISITKNSNNKGYTIFGDILKNKSPQKINITIDEYIRYEDIVQPYPVLLRFNDENGNEVSWGGKFRIGSTITRIGSAADSNLLPNIYNIFGLLLNDNQVTSSKVIVEKTMVFKAKSAYIFDNNEPNCILSPRLLRIPNSSYKILGHIPDISGHGNHGVIHNSAYGEGSGVNEDGSYQFDGVDDFVTIPTVTGGGKQVLMKVNNNTINSMLYDQRSSGASPNSLNSDFAIYNTNTVDNNLIAYQSRLVGKTYIDGILNTNITCEDLLGVLHNITITCDIVAPNNGVVPNIGRGGVLKDLYSNMALYDFMLFDSISTDDKIKELNEYVGIEAKVELPPYYWDAYGKTNLDVDRGIVPQLGIAKDYSFASFDNEMAWYLIPNDNYINVVSRNGYEITLKNLSTGVNGWRFQNSTVKGFISHDIPFRIKANKSIRVYWDMHSYKVSTGAEFGEVISITNVSPNKDTYINLRHLTEEELAKLDTNKDRMYYLLWFDLSTIAVNEEVVIEMLPVEGGRNLWLNNYNFAYDKMSGFGGYEFDKFTNTSRWIETKRENGIEVIEKNDYSFTAKRVGTGEYFWDFKNNSIRTLDKELTVKAVSNNNVSIRWEFKYRTAEKPDIDSAIVLVKQAMTPNVPITVTLPYKTTEEQIELGVIEGSTYYLFYFDPTDIPVNREYTVEMLPLYPNGLVYDAVTDYSKNSDIPALDDFTAIMKRKWLKKQGCPLIKGSKVYEGGNGNTLLFEWDKAYNFVFYKRTDIIEGELPDNISFITPTNYNGNVITRGSEQDTNGICIAGDGNAGFANMVFYKLILYPKTIPLLQINFLKNLMERDEIIDLNNPIFKNESNAL